MAMKARSKTFSKNSPMYEVDLKKTDSYEDVKMKIVEALELDDTCIPEFVLLTSRGCIIRDEMIKGKKWEIWTLGGYLTKRHISAKNLVLGVGKPMTIDTCSATANVKKRKIGMKVT